MIVPPVAIALPLCTVICVVLSTDTTVVVPVPNAELALELCLTKIAPGYKPAVLVIPVIVDTIAALVIVPVKA